MDASLVGFLGVIIGALVSFLSTLIVSKRQNNIALKNIKISMLQNKISKVEIVLSKILSVKMDINTDTSNLFSLHVVTATFGAFSEKVAFSQQCHHYLPKELVSELNTISVEVNESFFQGRARKNIDTETVNELFTKVQRIESMLLNQIHSKLTDWQLELDEELNI
jgi:hypothetical protein